MINKITQEFNYNNEKIIIETGIISRKSSSSILISINNTKILVSILELNKKKNNNIFFPLTVNYYERSYSYKKFPNNLLNREIRQNENEILISRLIDRSIRPSLMNINNYNNELHITVIVLSIDENFNPDIISIIGVSSALSILIKEFNPIFCVRLSINEKKEYIINPKINIYENNDLNIIISGNNNSITMIESKSNLIDYDIIINSINYGFKNAQVLIDNIIKFKDKFNNINNFFNNNNKNIIEKNNYINITKNEYLNNLINILVKEDLENLLLIDNKINRNIKIDEIKNKLLNNINNILSFYNEDEILYNFNLLLKKKIREKIRINHLRLDNRKYNEIRNIDIILDFIPNTHGSCLFTKENTQSLVVLTLGNDDKNITSKNKKFLFHYNFLNYCFGEIGFLSFPKRREIGHGKLSYNSIFPIIPNYNSFPYIIRIVSEILESDGSSSMASVCCSSLALMNSGISNKHIAGIAMGLFIFEDNKYIILSDISGEEDNYGDMDMKISGDYNGISSLQMDVKICKNININLLKKIFYEAKLSLKIILDKMYSIISNPNKISKNIPIIKTIKINTNYIKNIIGKGGSVIKKIISETGSEININNDGTIKILSDNQKILELTIEKINNLLFIPKIGNIYMGKIIKKIDKGFIIYIESINKQIFINYNIKKNDYNINEFIKIKITNINKNNNITFNILKNEK